MAILHGFLVHQNLLIIANTIFQPALSYSLSKCGYLHLLVSESSLHHSHAEISEKHLTCYAPDALHTGEEILCISGTTSIATSPFSKFFFCIVFAKSLDTVRLVDWDHCLIVSWSHLCQQPSLLWLFCPSSPFGKGLIFVRLVQAKVSCYQNLNE